MTNKEYIGLLDSGVGGLSVLSKVVDLMPSANYIFFGDTKNIPYGTKTPDEIFNFTKDILYYFLENNVKNVVIACNTTSAVAYSRLREEFSGKLKIFPLIQSAAPSIAQGLNDYDTVAVLATRATINSREYQKQINKINPKINVLGIDCTGFVEIVENRLYEDPASIRLIKSKLEIAKSHNAKKVVMGCTHYPYLEEIFKTIFDVEYFNPAVSISKKVKNEVNLDNCKDSKLRFVVSKNPEEFIKSAKMFFEVKEAQLVDLSYSYC